MSFIPVKAGSGNLCYLIYVYSLSNLDCNSHNLKYLLQLSHDLTTEGFGRLHVKDDWALVITTSVASRPIHRLLSYITQLEHLSPKMPRNVTAVELSDVDMDEPRKNKKNTAANGGSDEVADESGSEGEGEEEEYEIENVLGHKYNMVQFGVRIFLWYQSV